MQSSGCQWSAAEAEAAKGEEVGSGVKEVELPARPSSNTSEQHCKAKLAASKDNLASSASSLSLQSAVQPPVGKSNLPELANTLSYRPIQQQQQQLKLSEANNQVGDQVKRRRSSEAQLTPLDLDYRTSPSHHPYRVLDSNILRPVQPAEHNGEQEHQQQNSIQQQSSSQQRIKVTLSAPSQPEETATSSSQPSNNKAALPARTEEPDPASRWAARDSQLRRIASQRIQRRQLESQPQPSASGQERASGSPTTTSALATTSSITASQTTTKASQPQNINTNSKLEEPSTRQLAIYINGKIRSNSIFCRSNSSSSFNGLLNRFTSSSNTTNALQSSSSQEVDRAKLDSSVPDFATERKTRKKQRSRDNPSENSCLATASSFVSPITGNGSRSVQIARDRLVRTLNRLRCTRHLWSATQQNSNTLQTGGQLQRLAARSVQDQEGVEEGVGGEEAKLKERKEEEELPTAGYKLNPSSMFLRKAMRYYRLWIYSANLAIFAGTLIFILSSLYVASDYRIQLLLSRNDAPQGDASENVDNNNLLSLSEPSLLLAYAVIAIQAGLLQALGCFGAIRMKERLIQAFWYLILGLTVFDLLFLLYWLNRYQLIVGSLREHLQVRLNRHYGHSVDHYPMSSAAAAATTIETATSEQQQYQLDKTFTEILDKIQPESRCCGISSSLDFKHSKWREMKLNQITEKLLQSARGKSSSSGQILLDDDEGGGTMSLNISQLESLVQRLPLVPATCCRPSSVLGTVTPFSQNRPPDIRVPAWSPSMVVEELNQARSKSNLSVGSSRQRKAGQKQNSDEDEDDTEEDTEAESGEDSPIIEHDLAQLLDERWRNWPTDKATLSSSPGTPDKFKSEQEEGRGRQRLLAKQEYYNRERAQHPVSTRLRRWALESRVNEQEQVLTRVVSETDALPSTLESLPTTAEQDKRPELSALRELLFVSPGKNGSDFFSIQNASADERASFKWPNQLALSYEQYKTIERYLLGLWRMEQVNDNTTETGSTSSRSRERRELFVSVDSKVQRNHSANERQEYLLKQELARILREDSQVSCAPRSYYDKATIYTRGCQPEIRAWLNWSANILFVTGFCVLTVLKFCSLVLLRLEIREMIHKIRVLKGMATEYNALHDLEAYLPRPSVCAQAAELTPCGVALAGSGLPMTAGGGVNPPHRLGGSFSEAVQAAQQQQQQQKELQQLGAGLASQGRASSMKIMAAAAMLAPSSCNHQLGIRSSSTSSAHLQLLGQHLLSGTSDHLFQANTGLSAMSRRHTAVAVCPGAAGATNMAGTKSQGAGATTAALCNVSQLSRRGTCATASASQQQQPLLNPNINQLQAQVQVQVGAINRPPATRESNRMSCAAGAGGSHQLLSLVYQHHPFKRQSSSGAHSAGNFSLEPAAPNPSLAESRRSIH